MFDAAEMDAYLREQMERSNIPELAHAFAQDGHISHMTAFDEANPYARQITIRRLLEHTSGIRFPRVFRYNNRYGCLKAPESGNNER